MKRLLLISLMLSLAFASMAQTKVVESSSKKQPKWVNGLEKDYIITVGSGSTAQEAQQNALNMIKEQIVSAVAENVQTTSEMRVEENTVNKVSLYLENFATTTTTTSGPVPFLQGISLSKVDEFYWEKLQDKKTRTVRFNYHLKYPFPKIEVWKLVEEFKKRDKEMTRQLDELIAAADNVDNVDVIQKNIDELKVLSDYFMDGRKNTANLGITRYRGLYNSLELVEIESGLGELKYALRLGDKYVSTSRKPNTSSECARITSTVNNKNYTIIKYDYFNCYDDPENHILVTYRFGNNNVQKKFFFDTTADKAAIFVNEPIRLVALSGEGVISNATMDITLVSKYSAPFTINKVEIEIQGQAPIVVDNIGQNFSGKGNHSLKLNIDKALKADETSTSGKRISMLSGYIHFTSDKTGEKKTYRIYNHTYTTDW
ncbi:MAG: hypothetical protein WC951_05325 [Bacteroidales bacterium]|nr:hypothetical protein [Tenuifilaceae bacterium]